jgi:hypothetical protein
LSASDWKEKVNIDKKVSKKFFCQNFQKVLLIKILSTREIRDLIDKFHLLPVLLLLKM